MTNAKSVKTSVIARMSRLLRRSTSISSRRSMVSSTCGRVTGEAGAKGGGCWPVGCSPPPLSCGTRSDIRLSYDQRDDGHDRARDAARRRDVLTKDRDASVDDDLIARLDVHLADRRVRRREVEPVFHAIPDETHPVEAGAIGHAARQADCLGHGHLRRQCIQVRLSHLAADDDLHEGLDHEARLRIEVVKDLLDAPLDLVLRHADYPYRTVDGVGDVAVAGDGELARQLLV